MLAQTKNETKKFIKAEAISINKSLRQGFFNSNFELEQPRNKPFHGFIENGIIRESLGPFPEYIIPTLPCLNCLKGYCNPCFFSKLPINTSLQKEIKNSLIDQTKFIIFSKDDILLQYQKYRPISHLNSYDVVFCYATNGSFLNNYETNFEDRIYSLKLLADFFKKNKLTPLMYLELCSTDFINAYRSGEMSLILPFLKELNTTVLFGLESYNDFTRNYIWNKNLDICDFEKSIKLAKSLGLGQGAFIFSGFFSMTESEIIEDVKQTLDYLHALDVMPVLMFPNLKSYTIPHLLHKYGRYKLISPQTVVQLYLYLHDKFETKKSINRDCWLSGDLWGGPPASNVDIFNSEHGDTCCHCSELIVNSCMEFRVTHDMSHLKQKLAQLETCSNGCKAKYNDYIFHQKNLTKENIEDRVLSDLLFAKKHLSSYLNSESND